MTDDDQAGIEHLPASIRERLEGNCLRHPEHLAIGCAACDDEQEIGERDKVAAAALAKCVDTIPARYREARTDNTEIRGWVDQFHQSPRTTPSLLLLGPTGTGKTYQAYAALKAAVTWARPNRVGVLIPVRWQALTYADLTASMRPRGRDYDTEQVLKTYLDTDLLFVDDLGAGKITEAVEEVTYRLINGRYNDMRPSIFTSNLELPALRDAIGDRVASRLSETSVRVVLNGPDRRRVQAA